MGAYFFFVSSLFTLKTSWGWTSLAQRRRNFKTAGTETIYTNLCLWNITVSKPTDADLQAGEIMSVPGHQCEWSLGDDVVALSLLSTSAKHICMSQTPLYKQTVQR